ncbi:MAG: DUF4007 family protein [Anaerolineae bacterium]|nr:DUF4007 family protein [Anaerolineae bacterium]
MLLSTPIPSRPAFGGHEKFVFRQGWLKKAIDAAQQDPAVFSKEDAFVHLGVGKNMAASIRYWGLATGLLENVLHQRGIRTVIPSALGLALLGENGFDPYLEDIGSLWLIHWQLASNRERGLVWHLVFSRYYDVEFRKVQLLQFLKKQMTQLAVQTTEGMIEREMDVFLRTYVAAQPKKGLGEEENLDCPLVDLHLLSLSPSDSVYRFQIGKKPSLPTAIFGYSLLEYLKEKIASQRTVMLDECVYQPGSPGQIFKLDENSVMVYLEDLEVLTNGAIRLQESAGIRQVYLYQNFPELGMNLLQAYYE